MNVLAAITMAGQIIATFIVPGIDLALKVKSLLELDPSVQVNITNLTGEALSADQQTLDLIAAWKQQHSLPA
jgi:hypothetical protein